jgi:penicillin amidase
VNLARLLLRLFLGRRLPLTRGSRTVAGLRAPLRIHRDRWGIPCIEAGDDTDACFGMGFCHGQDRTFQLELLVRLIRGTLAELIGPMALPADRLSRRIGFRRSAQQQWPLVPSDLQEKIEAYARGVNAAHAAGLPRRPHEFVLLRNQPSTWEPADSLGVVNVISFTLCCNWDVELARLHILEKDGPEAVRALDPSYPEWLPATAPPGQPAGPGLDRLLEDLAVFLAAARIGGGSNNWAVAGSRTTTGRPILANDPHLTAALPAHWYLLQARTPTWAVAGASFLGGPAVLAGHNGHAAWGVTAACVDNTDLFVEQIGPDSASIRQGDGFVPCPVREETIAVRGEAAVTERVLVTPRGPIITPAVVSPGRALSLRATWLDARPYDGLLRLQWMRSFDELRRGLGPWPASSQNIAYADVTGAVGWKIVGQAPVRRKGKGILPMPGWDPEVGWEDDLIPAAEMPHLLNPECGFVATANNRPLPEGIGPYLGNDWMDGYRVAAIARNLAARRDWDVAAMQRLQMDQQALAWEDMRTAILAASDADPDTRIALELLRAWDGRVSVESTAAAVYELFLAEMIRRVAQTKAPRSADYAMGGRVSPLAAYNFFCYRRTGHLARLLRLQPKGWFSRSWPDEVADSLAAAVRLLRSRHGADSSSWGWGHIRPLTMHHPLGRGWLLSRIFNLDPVPYGGDADVINQGAALPLDPLGNVDNIASIRLVIDVGDWSASRFALPGGQSGNPLSPHYDDLFTLWLRGEGVAIPWTPDEVRAAARQTLELLPGRVAFVETSGERQVPTGQPHGGAE